MSMYPHRWCLLGNAPLIWLHIASDLLIAFAYFVIPSVLYVARRQLTNLAGRRIIFLFCCFIAACGLTHLMDALTMFVPYYEFQAGVKATTAALSWATVAALYIMARERAS
jgi:hypothetical protein